MCADYVVFYCNFPVPSTQPATNDPFRKHTWVSASGPTEVTRFRAGKTSSTSRRKEERDDVVDVLTTEDAFRSSPAARERVPGSQVAPPRGSRRQSVL